MYKKLQQIECAFGKHIFGLAIGVLLDEGVKSISELTDEQIKELNGNSFISTELWQTIVKVARSIATTIKNDPSLIISYCQDNQFFNSIEPTSFEDEEFARVVWKHQDIIDAYKERFRNLPTEDEVYEILDLINIDKDGGLEDCSYGWEIINNAIDEYMEGKWHIKKNKTNLDKKR